MQNKGGLPEEHPCRRPPPSTSSPCPAWFFRLRSPFFRGSKTAVQKRLAPVQLLALVQLAQKRAPDIQPNALLLPVAQPPPAGRGMRILVRQVLPAGAAPQNPENPFQHPTVLDPRAATLAVLARFGEQGRDLLPLRFGQQRSRPCHRPSLGAADSAYPSFSKTQPPLFQSLVYGYATASSLVPTEPRHGGQTWGFGRPLFDFAVGARDIEPDFGVRIHELKIRYCAFVGGQ